MSFREMLERVNEGFQLIARNIDSKEKAEKIAKDTGGIVMVDDKDMNKFMVVSSRFVEF